jgi:hypothetical protein
MTSDRRLILLGPQPEFQTLRAALARLQIHGRVAVVTAGWEEDEADDEALRRAIPGDATNLALFQRSERLFAEDVELIKQLRLRQDELRHLRDVYRIRLDRALEAAQQVLVRQESLVDLEPERESAIEMVRQLDRQYVVRTRQVYEEYERRLQTSHRPSVANHRRELAEILADVQALLISGGHTTIILNRLQIFGILDVHQHLPLIAWSAGTMALSDQIVFFHDSPPQGEGNAEVLRAGMGLFHDILPLPSARDRMKLDDRIRVALFARRFAMFRCVVFDQDTMLDRRDGQWTIVGPAERLDLDGILVPMQS